MWILALLLPSRILSDCTQHCDDCCGFSRNLECIGGGWRNPGCVERVGLWVGQVDGERRPYPQFAFCFDLSPVGAYELAGNG